MILFRDTLKLVYLNLLILNMSFPHCLPMYIASVFGGESMFRRSGGSPRGEPGTYFCNVPDWNSILFLSPSQLTLCGILTLCAVIYPSYSAI